MAKGKKLIFNNEEIAEIKRLYKEENLTVKQVGEVFGVSYTGMNNAMRRAGIELRPGARKYTIDEHAFDKIDNEEAAYWYGFIYADGCVVKTYLQVALSRKDRDQITKIRKFLKANNPIRNIETNCIGFFYGIHLSDRLRELGIVPSRPDHQPVLDNVPPDMMHHWIRGFFDGDGSATKSGRIVFCGSEELMTWLKDYFAEHAGTNPDLRIHMHQTGSIYYLSVGRSVQARKVAKVMYCNATIWMERKRNVIDSWPEFDPAERARKGWVARKKNAGGG